MTLNMRPAEHMPFETFGVMRRDREPLLRFMLDALERVGCRVLRASQPDTAPFQFSFVTPTGERMGVVAYAFYANSRLTKNRPDDEYRFQIKYGSKDGKEHRLWQDHFGLYTTLLVGISPEEGFFVGADPVLNSPTKFFISKEFKRARVEHVIRDGWHTWERDRRAGDESPVEVLVGGTAHAFLRYVRLEREALGEDQGHRQLLAERASDPAWVGTIVRQVPAPDVVAVPNQIHRLAEEFELREAEVLDLIAQTRRLKMAVRGWVAEEHLLRRLKAVSGVTDCARLDEEGGPDLRLRYRGSRPLSIECKNVLRQRTREGLPRVDFQRTRASKSDPCSRYYSASDFDVLAACLHAVIEQWEFSFALPRTLDAHAKCKGKLSNNVRVDDRWQRQAEVILAQAAA
ncbi:MAG: hypothetical protein AB2A00_27110 [Myxococcota bacterium]